jgi:hypothetical protein
MGSPRVVHERSNRRTGVTRFIVPHDSFRWFTRSIAVSTLATGLGLAVAMWIYSQSLYSAIGLPPMAEDPAALAAYTRLSMISTAVVVIVGTLYVTMVSAYLFHRVAGPVYRIEQHMREVIDGHPVQPLRFRDGDQLGSLAETYNQLLHAVDALEPKPLEKAGE